ncbi:MAG: DUF4249 domain-containing protein [Flavobacteriaceae bacterium]|nr:DUF4249 domain-containing protein [Flavobacteriaceae bacterium]
MKRLLFILSVLSLIWSSCQEVITVELPNQEPKLIVDALIRIDTTISSTLVTVSIRQTSDFFGEISPVSVDQITMSNLDNPGNNTDQVLDETEPGSGIYQQFFSTEELARDRWFLQINYQGEFYVAESLMQYSVPIDQLTIGDGSLFSGDVTELLVRYSDIGGREDYYLFDYGNDDFFASEDVFYDGQQFEFSYFYDEQFNPGDTLTVSIMGIDRDFFNYMNLLREQSEGGFGPFATPAVSVRGNLINATDINNNDNYNNVNNPDNYALGYFAIVQEYKGFVVVE